MDQHEFSTAIKEAYRNALAHADSIKEEAEKIRAEAALALKEANAYRAEAERNADEIFTSTIKNREAEFKALSAQKYYKSW